MRRAREALSRDVRGRLTVPDIVFILMSLAVVGALWPVVWHGLNLNAGQMDTGTLYLLRMMLPMALLVLLYVIYAKAVKGVA